LANVSQPFTYKGQPASNFAATSVFADFVVVQEIQAVKIGDDIPFSSACLISCGVLTGVGTVFNRAQVQLGQSTAVFGAGGVGLNVIQALRVKGARRIIAVDTEPAKEALARKFGATDFIDARGIDPVAAIRDIEPHQPGMGAGPFNAGGVDWAFDCVGHPQVTYNAVESLDWGGTCVIIGVPAPDVELHAIITRLVQVDRGIIGCRYGSNRPHYDVPLIIDLYRRGELMLDELVSATYPLAEFDTVVRDMHEGKLARGVLTL
jgi:S-(hydroxymethyl)glutathione dehydrogenase/alcohol dehydrogenase